MSVKAILILCAQALLVKSALGQCTSRAAVADASALAAPCGGLAYPAAGLGGLAYNGLNTGLAGCGLSYNGLNSGLAGSGLAYNGLNAGLAGIGMGYNGLNNGLAGTGLAYNSNYAPAMEFSPTSGGALPVSSGSPIAPVGISVVSDNVYEGVLSAAGELPFVGTVAMEGVLPSAGAGAVNHACGNGRNAMISDNAAFAPAGYGAVAAGPLGAYGSSAAFAPGAFTGLNSGFAGLGCGCGN